MCKRFFIFILALCCAFFFICQPAAAVGTTAVLTSVGVAQAVLASFGIVLAADAAYQAFGTLLQDSVLKTGSAGSSWWNGALAGNIALRDLNPDVKTAVWSVVKQAADAIPSTESDSYTFTFTPQCYIVNVNGVLVKDFRNTSYTITSRSGVAPIMFATCYFDGNYFNADVAFYSYSPFYFKDVPAEADSSGLYSWGATGAVYWYDSLVNSPDCYVGFKYFSSKSSARDYILSTVGISTGVSSSAGGATAAYPTYGYDGVNLPNIDLTQAGLIGEDGTSTVSDLIAQLQSGAITWEDYIGTVAPGQTATITLTDENGAAVTYTLVNTGIGTRVETGTDVTEATEPVVVPVPGELTGTLADTEAKSFLGALADTIAKPFADVIAKVQAIPAAISEALATTFKPVADLGHFALDLSKYFPFCIPFDLYDFFMCLNASPEAPVIDWEIPLPGGKTYPMQIDLSPFNSVAQLLRTLELLLFCIGLAYKTRDLIKG